MDRKPLVTRRGEAESLRVTGTELRFLCPAAATGRAWSLMELLLPRDAGPPLHEHPWDEGYYLVEGEARFTVGDEQLLAGPGDFVYVPGGVPHAFQGASDSPGRLIVFDAPAAAEAFFRDVDREVEEYPRDAHKLGPIGMRHQLRFIR